MRRFLKSNISSTNLSAVLCSLFSVLLSRRKAGKPASPANTNAHPRKHLMINSWFSFPPPSLNRHLRYDTQRFENGRLRKPPLLEISFGTRGSIISMLTHKKFCGSTCTEVYNCQLAIFWKFNSVPDVSNLLKLPTPILLEVSLSTMGTVFVRFHFRLRQHIVYFHWSSPFQNYLSIFLSQLFFIFSCSWIFAFL